MYYLMCPLLPSTTKAAEGLSITNIYNYVNVCVKRRFSSDQHAVAHVLLFFLF